MSAITAQQLVAIMPNAKNRVVAFLCPLSDAMAEFEINTPQRQASFLAQLAHESGELFYMQEIASGTAYEGRDDLGNTQPGDGIRFKGRGAIQITGRLNYTAAMLALDIDCVEHPELLEQPINACRSAAWFWKSHGLNELADKNEQKLIRKRVNGGYTHLDRTLAYYVKALTVLSPNERKSA